MVNHDIDGKIAPQNSLEVVEDFGWGLIFELRTVENKKRVDIA